MTIDERHPIPCSAEQAGCKCAGKPAADNGYVGVRFARR